MGLCRGTHMGANALDVDAQLERMSNEKKYQRKYRGKKSGVCRFKVEGKGLDKKNFALAEIAYEKKKNGYNCG